MKEKNEKRREKEMILQYLSLSLNKRTTETARIVSYISLSISRILVISL